MKIEKNNLCRFLLIIILLIWYGITLFTRNSRNKGNTYNSSSKNSFEFNISGLGNLFSGKNIDKSFLDPNFFKNMILPIPQFNMTPISYEGGKPLSILPWKCYNYNIIKVKKNNKKNK